MNRREQEREFRKTAILDAAEKLFFSRSYDAVTMDEIKTEAQFSKRTIYQYFQSKDQMYAAIILRAFKFLCQLSLDNLTSHPVSTSIEELRIFANSMQRFLSEKEDYARIILEFENNYQRFDHSDVYILESTQLRNQLFEQLMQVFERGQHKTEIMTSYQAEELTLIVWGQIVGTMNLILNQSSAFPDKESILTASLLEKSIVSLIEGITFKEGSDSNES